MSLYSFKKETEHPYIIYGLIDPRDNKLRYIGKTIQGMKRLKNHLKPSSLKEGNTRKNNWLKKLLEQGLMPNFAIFISYNNYLPKSVNNKILYNLEQYFITYFKKHLPYELTNDCDGGEGSIGRVISKETRKKMSESAKRRGLPQALLNQQKPKNKPKAPKIYKSKAVPGKKQKYYDSMKIAIIGKNILTEEIIEFKGMRDAEKFFNNKFNKTSLRNSIKKQTPYYGYIWNFK